eukprot:6198903-Pleurochrysis_carterae.AAC.3
MCARARQTCLHASVVMHWLRTETYQDGADLMSYQFSASAVRRIDLTCGCCLLLSASDPPAVVVTAAAAAVAAGAGAAAAAASIAEFVNAGTCHGAARVPHPE